MRGEENASWSHKMPHHHTTAVVHGLKEGMSRSGYEMHNWGVLSRFAADGWMDSK